MHNFILMQDNGLNDKYDFYDMNFPMHFGIDFNLYMSTFPYKQRCILFANATKILLFALLPKNRMTIVEVFLKEVSYVANTF